MARLTEKVVSEFARELGLRLTYEMRGGYSVVRDREHGYASRHTGGSLREALVYLRGVRDGREDVDKPA